MYNKKEQTDKGVSFMEGRRVSRRKPRRNPLYTLFMGLLALSLVLFITVIVLSFKLKGARRDLADAQTKIEQLRGGSQTGEDNQLTNGEDGLLTAMPVKPAARRAMTARTAKRSIGSTSRVTRKLRSSRIRFTISITSTTPQAA